jgi:tight adherence protein B
MSDREILAKFNSLLSAGLSLDQATRNSDPAQLSPQFQLDYRYLLSVCREAGAAPISALANLEKIAEQRQENAGRLAISSANPKATARLVLWLPLGAAFLGQVLGLGSLVVFLESPVALVSLLIGLILLISAQHWSNRILSKANRPLVDEPIIFDAIALCLDAGLSAMQARLLAMTSYEDVFLKPIAEHSASQIDALIEFSESSGAPIAKLFRNRAETDRRQFAYRQLQAIETVSIRLLAPLAVLVLPAFVLIAVLPITISLLTSK